MTFGRPGRESIAKNQASGAVCVYPALPPVLGLSVFCHAGGMTE